MLKALALAISTFSTAAVAQTITIQTHGGSTELDLAPETVAVFDVAALDTLIALGVTPEAVVRPIYVDYLQAATKDAATVGTLFEPDYEALAALSPDLIIAGGRSYAAIPSLSKLAPTIDMTIQDDVVGQSMARLTAFGALFQKEAEAAALVDALTAKLRETRAALEGQGTALIVMTVGPKISVYGPNGRFGWIYSSLGLTAAASDIQSATHGEAVSFEFIRNANPDILIVIDRLAAIGQEGARAEATLDNALIRQVSAWKAGKVIHLRSAPLYIAEGGIQSMMTTLEQIAAPFTAD